jgi:uroporphyrinogen decarboxylase
MKKINLMFDGKKMSCSPLWLMRQAGRYLPEYRALRERAGSFLDLVYSPENAATVTTQPIDRFGFDAAILFSDILVVPHALGVPVRFESGEGPRLEPVHTIGDCLAMKTRDWARVWAPVIETVGLVRGRLSSDKTLIGFAGAPWTIACYMVEGQGGDHQFKIAIDHAQSDPIFFDELLDVIVESTIAYLCAQIQAGADVIQIFDSWAGAAPADKVVDWIIKPTQKIVDGVRAHFPHVPIIGFPRGVSLDTVVQYVEQTGVQGIQLDSHIDYKSVRARLPVGVVTQGFLSPELLRTGGPVFEKSVKTILEQTADDLHIFNLSHGILPDTPIKHVEQLVQWVREENT